MNQSEKIDQLATALSKAQPSLSAARKDATNPHFKSQYATLQSIWDAAREVLAPNGLSVVQTFEATDGKLMNIRTTLMHTSGQWIAGVLSMAPQQANPQGIGSAITYGRRYALASILGIVADEDDDGNGSVEEGREKPVYRAPAGKSAPAHTESLPDDGSPADWRKCPVPAFIKGKGATVGEMSEKDLLWWGNNYTPKPFKGSIPQGDQDFRDALTAALIERHD